MRYLLVLMGVMAMLAAGAGTALAAPNNAANNPQIVANYTSGDHGIPGEYYLHQGSDVVMQAGNSGNFQQWFSGVSSENNNNQEGDHSVWMSIGSSTTCPNSTWILVQNAHAS